MTRLCGSRDVFCKSRWLSVRRYLVGSRLTVQLVLYSPQKIYRCGRPLTQQHSYQKSMIGRLDTLPTKWRSGAQTMSIQCGTATTHGYFHIALGESDHQKRWRNRITKANPSASTDSRVDLMWWSASQSWKSPLKTLDVGGGKVCRPGLIEMHRPDSSGKTVPSTSPTC